MQSSETIHALVVSEWFPFSSKVCDAWLSLESILMATSLIHLGLAVYSCRVALLRPLRYKLRQAVGYIVTQLGVAWGLSLVVAVPFIAALLVYNIDTETVEFKGCRPWQMEHTLAHILLTFYVPIIVLCILYLWTLRTARSRTLLALHLAETASNSTSNGDVTGIDRMDTELNTTLEKSDAGKDSFIAWHQARLMANATAATESHSVTHSSPPQNSPSRGITPQVQHDLGPHSILTTVPSNDSTEMNTIANSNAPPVFTDNKHLCVEQAEVMLHMEKLPKEHSDAKSDDSALSADDITNSDVSDDSIASNKEAKIDKYNDLSSTKDSSNSELELNKLCPWIDEKETNNSNSIEPEEETNTAYVFSNHDVLRINQAAEINTGQTLDLPPSDSQLLESALSPETERACNSIPTAVSSNDSSPSTLNQSHTSNYTVDEPAISQKIKNINAKEGQKPDTGKNPHSAESISEVNNHKAVSCSSSNRSQGKATKEQLNEPLEEKDILLELERDTQHLLEHGASKGLIGGLENPGFDADGNDDGSEQNAAGEETAEVEENPLSEAIRVKHNKETKDGDNGEVVPPGSDNHNKEDGTHGDTSRRSSVSVCSNYSGARRSILRRNGSKRGASTKSVKFSSKVETKVLTQDRPPSRKGKSIVTKGSSQSYSNQVSNGKKKKKSGSKKKWEES